jgi:hypothetical protein
MEEVKGILLQGFIQRHAPLFITDAWVPVD